MKTKYSYINYIVIALMILNLSSMSVKASVSYRVMSSKQEWVVDQKSNTDLGNGFCTAFNVFEENFPIYLSQSLNDKAVLTFYLSNLVVSEANTHEIQIMFDDRMIISQKIEKLVKPVIKVSLNQDDLQTLYNANNISLSVNSLGYEFQNIQLHPAQNILKDCLVNKSEQISRQVSNAPMPQNTDIKPTSETVNEKSRSLEVLDRRVSDFNRPRAMGKSNREIKSAPVMLDEADWRTGRNQRSIQRSDVSEAMQMEQEMLAELSMSKPDDSLQATQTKPEVAVEQYTNEEPIMPPTVKVAIEEQKRTDFTEDERELFESMKTKMFLLEQEKQAAKSKLTEIRQKEIEALKIDIGSKQKIEEQAEKIRLLQEKLKKYQYRQIGDEGAENDRIDNKMDEVVESLANQGDK